MVPTDETGAAAEKMTGGNECCVYTVEGLQAELRQGEIISNVVEYRYDSNVEQLDAVRHPFVLIASQDCDLLREHDDRVAGAPSQLSGVLLFDLELVENVDYIRGKDLWKPITNNSNDRYQFLQAVPAHLDLEGIGIGEALADFRRFFTVHPRELWHQVSSGKATRRCRLEMPYREHFQTRAAFYLQRVALPEPHASI